MKTLKKRIAAILTFSMIFELLPVTALPAYAVQEELITGEGYEDAGLFEPYETDGDELVPAHFDNASLLTDADTDAVDATADGDNDWTLTESKKLEWKIEGGVLRIRDAQNTVVDSGKHDFKTSAGEVPWKDDRDSITSAEINISSYCTDLSGMFEGCTNLVSVDIEKLATKRVENISNMFKGCSSLASIEAYKLCPDTDSIVTDMSGLFEGCSMLVVIELIKYEKKSNGEYVYDKNGKKKVLSFFDTSNVRKMNTMFKGCSAVENIELDHFDTTFVEDMTEMFKGCSAIRDIDLSKFNLNKVTTDKTKDMLSCNNLESIKPPIIKNDVKVELPGQEWYRSDTNELVSFLDKMIPANKGIVITKTPSEDEDVLVKGSIPDIPDAPVTWILYKDGRLVVNGNGEIREKGKGIPWIVKVINGEEIRSKIKTAEINLSGTIDLSGMFEGCDNLESVTLTHLDTEKAINLSGMFEGCSSLEAVSLADFNTANVTDMSKMFKDCTSLKEVYMFQLDTSRVTDMSEMFSGCSALSEVDFTGEDTDRLRGKPRLFNTDKVDNMIEMFYGCASLNVLDLSVFKLRRTTSVDNIIIGCNALESLYSPLDKGVKIDLPRCGGTPLGVWKNNSNNKRVSSFTESEAGTLFTYEKEEGNYGGSNGVDWWVDSNHVLHVEGVGNFRDPDAPVPWVVYKDDILRAEIDLTESTDLSRMFENCDKLTDITWKNNSMTDTCTNMFAMFRGCASLNSIDLSNFSTSKVTDMSYMFEGCEKITVLSFVPDKFKTDNVIDMRGMFMGCKSLTKLDISCFKMGKIGESYRVDKMLENCTILEEISTPDELKVKLFLPVIDDKGWILKGDTEFPRQRFLVIPAKTKQATTFVTAADIGKITLYEGDGSTPLKPSYDLDPGQELEIIAKVEPADANPLDIVWTSADKDTASVNVVATTLNEAAGTVQVVVKAGDKTGNALITASFGDADAQTFTIRVSSFLKINPSALKIESGTTSENAITATFQNNTYTPADLIWTSEYPKILKVIPTPTGATLEAKSGITTDKQVKVTATTSDGKYSDICIVTIIENSNPEPVWGDIDEQYIRDEFSNDPSKVPTGLWYLMPYNTTLSEDVVGYKVYMGSDTLDYSRVYTGSNITFDEELRMYYGVRRLWRGRDYTVVYRNNKLAADSSDKKYPCFTISGVGSFQNTAEFRFNILREDINNAKLYSDEVIPIDAKTKLASIQPSLRYNGTKLLLNKDYKAYYYKDNISGTPIDNPKTYPAAAGDTYYIVMSANEIEDGNFAGVWSNPVKLITLTPGDKTVAKMNRVKVRTKQLLWSETPYKLTDLFNNTVSDNDVFRVVLEGKELVYGTDFTVDDVELFDSGEYTIKIHGTGTPGSLGVSFIGEKSVKLEIKGTPASKVKFAAFTDTVYYNGEPLTMEDLYAEDSTGYENVTLYTYKNGIPELLVEGRDYDEPEFINNTAATGRVSLVIKLKGAYSGVITKTIRVLRYNFNDDTKGLVDINVDNVPFCRAGAKPKVTVTFDGKELVENIDYKLTYKNNNKLGEETDGARAPQVVITGIGNFSGKQTKKFTIYKAPLENIKMVLDDKEYKAKFAKNYYKSSPRILDGGSTVKIGKDKDLEPIGKKAYVYSYANGGGQIPANITKDIPDGTLIEVSVLITAGEKSPYEAGSLTLKGYYRFVSKYKNLKNANISMATPTELVCSDSIDEVMDILDKNLTITMKTQKNETIKLVQDRDYEIVSIENYMNPGTAILTIKGKNSYAGTVTCKLKVYRRKE